MGGGTEQIVRRARITDIIILASKLSGFDPKVITGYGRSGPVVRVRQAVYRVAREHGHSFPLIARVMGGRDHSTVMWGAERMRMHYNYDESYKAFVDGLRAAALDAVPFVDMEPVALPALLKPVPVAVEPPRKLRPRNDFSATEKRDGSHAFHDSIAKGSRALLAALEAHV